MILDCFLFFDELDLLEIRLNSMAPYVDIFVLCESEVTFSGKPKSLYFKENRSRFKDFEIFYVKAGDGMAEKTGNNTGEAWKREYYQREVLLKWAVDMTTPEDIILLSDVDEIPDLEGYRGAEGAFKMRMYYYYLNCYAGQNWKGTVARKHKNIKSANEMRDLRNKSVTVGTGWHFSTLGSVDQITKKIEAFSHQELNTEAIKSALPEKILSLSDPYDRRFRFKIEMPSGPKWLLENKEKYQDLWHP